jgi:hypothetical protein
VPGFAGRLQVLRDQLTGERVVRVPWEEVTEAGPEDPAPAHAGSAAGEADLAERSLDVLGGGTYTPSVH